MKAKIYITYKDGILDPQGKTVGNALDSIGLSNIDNVTIGKFIEMDFDQKTSVDEAKKIAEESCKKLLANPNTEKFHYEILETK
tara:strand:- start:240 stop:491 length:252 start_codon:yes stop_codon:yes gene_type:complete